MFTILIVPIRVGYYLQLHNSIIIQGECNNAPHNHSCSIMSKQTIKQPLVENKLLSKTLLH